jgi:hypothetical protein
VSAASARLKRVQQGRTDVAGHGHRLAGAPTSCPVSAVTVVLPLVPVDGQHLRRIGAFGSQTRKRLSEQVEFAAQP